MLTLKVRNASSNISHSTAYKTYHKQRPLKYQPFTPKTQQKHKYQFNKYVPSFSKGTLSTVYPHIGILRSNWYNPKGALQTYTYGTAFLVTKNILITCTHNFFSTSRKRFADELLFLPDFQNGKVRYAHTRIRKAVRISQIKYGYFQNLHARAMADPIEDASRFKMEIMPTKYEISLVALLEQNAEESESEEQQQNKDGGKGLPIGCLHEQDFSQDLKVMVVGYPSQTYQGVITFQQAEIARCDLQGYFHSAQYCLYQQIPEGQRGGGGDRQRQLFKRLEIINYTSKTNRGVSGSPILAFKNGRCIVIGIHTHRGRNNDYNSGLYFNPQFLHLIQELQLSLKQKLLMHGYFLGDKKIAIIDATLAEPKQQLSCLQEEVVQESAQKEEQQSYSMQSPIDLSSSNQSTKSQPNSQVQDFGLLQYFTLKDLPYDDQKSMDKCLSHCSLSAPPQTLILPKIYLFSQRLLTPFECLWNGAG